MGKKLCNQLVLLFPVFQKHGLLLISLTALSFCFAYSCKDNPTDSEKRIKHPRDMTWTVDTIAYEGSIQTLMSSIWGSSPKDVWMCGHNDRGKGKLWHFNGTNWIHADFSGNEYSKLLGFTGNDIWLAGNRTYLINDGKDWAYQSKVWHYNGDIWQEIAFDYKSFLTDITGTSSNDIYACGQKGLVLYYNGIKWTNDTIPNYAVQKTDYQITDIIKYNNELFVITFCGYPVRKYLIKGTFDKWTVVDSFGSGDPVRFGDLGFKIGLNKKLYSYGNKGIFEYENGSWKNLFDISSDAEGGFFALSDNYKIGLTDRNGAYFSDGQIWTRLNLGSADKDVVYTDAWGNGEELFIIGWTLTGIQKTVVFHGK